LSIKEGELLKIRGSHDEEWLRCESADGRIGKVARAFVEILKTLPKRYALEGPRAEALYTYDGESEGDLYFIEGDPIQLLEVIDGGWLKGKLDNRIGIFPANYVKVIERIIRGTSVTTGPRAKARYNYVDVETDDDLAFEKGDIIKLLEKVDSEWYRGELEGKQGLFPVSYVDVIEDVASVADHHLESGPRAVALFDQMDTGNLDDLYFHKGDVIRLLERIDENWMRGELNGHEGMFPTTYVEIIEDLP
jgi:SH3 domain-containing protein 19